MRTDYLCRGQYRTIPPGEPFWVYGQCTIQSDDLVTIATEEGVQVEVDSKTLGRCSGVRDADGLLMYEGDVVSGLFLFEMEVAGVVEFRDGSFGLRWMRGKSEEFTPFTSMCNVTYKIIGTIYDNNEEGIS